MHLAWQSTTHVAKTSADMFAVTSQCTLPGIMPPILSPLYKAHKTSQIFNGLQALSMTTE